MQNGFDSFRLLLNLPCLWRGGVCDGVVAPDGGGGGEGLGTGDVVEALEVLLVEYAACQAYLLANHVGGEGFACGGTAHAAVDAGQVYFQFVYFFQFLEGALPVAV